MPYDKPCFLGLSHYFFTYKSYPALAFDFLPQILWNSIHAATAAVHSVITKAHHTPTAPIALLRMNSAGIITTIYRISEITSDGTPSPSIPKVCH